MGHRQSMLSQGVLKSDFDQQPPKLTVPPEYSADILTPRVPACNRSHLSSFPALGSDAAGAKLIAANQQQPSLTQPSDTEVQTCFIKS